MQSITFNDLKRNYAWLANSPLGETLEDTDDEFLAPICGIDEPNLETLIEVIRYWRIEYFSPELLDQLRKFERAGEINTDNKHEKEFYKKIIMFINYPNINDAIMDGHLDMVEYFHTRDIKSSGWISECETAAKYGRYEIFEYLRRQNYPCSNDVVNAAAEGGSLEILRILEQEKFKFNQDMLKIAFENGHVNIVDFLLNKGFYFQNSYAEIAVVKGHLEIVKFILGRDFYRSENLLPLAVQNGHLEITKILIPHFTKTEDLSAYAILSKNVELARYIIEECGLCFKACNLAVKSGKTEILDIVLEKGANFSGEETSIAAQNGDYHMLKYLYENLNEQFSYGILNYCSKHAECFEYCHKNGCPINFMATRNAIQYGSLETVQYIVIVVNKKDKKDKRLVTLAVEYGRLDIIQFLHDIKFPFDDKATLLAIEKKNIEMFILLRTLGYCNNQDINRAVENGAIDILEFLKENGENVTNTDLNIAKRRIEEFNRPKKVSVNININYNMNNVDDYDIY